jgi:hypothetical protein
LITALLEPDHRESPAAAPLGLRGRPIEWEIGPDAAKPPWPGSDFSLESGHSDFTSDRLRSTPSVNASRVNVCNVRERTFRSAGWLSAVGQKQTSQATPFEGQSRIGHC